MTIENGYCSDSLQRARSARERHIPASGNSASSGAAATARVAGGQSWSCAHPPKIAASSVADSLYSRSVPAASGSGFRLRSPDRHLGEHLQQHRELRRSPSPAHRRSNQQQQQQPELPGSVPEWLNQVGCHPFPDGVTPHKINFYF
ncbi:unnamed protein product [Gongylonema pulchrum]|uniref:Uncharacterized protein n=1 Tax=Gongylonema pulchrum TaxID=637853 RepID=A0A183DSB8_9BILA|nr:unnamed protein product [Gongylonema pulchrum]